MAGTRILKPWGTSEGALCQDQATSARTLPSTPGVLGRQVSTGHNPLGRTLLGGKTRAGGPALAVGARPLTVAGVRLDTLAAHVPEAVLSQIPACAEKFQINSSLRLAHFLAQCAHESGGFQVTQENLNYSAEGLQRTWPSRFPGNLAEVYARQPEKIASRVYGGRLGNGDEAGKDGYKFRGRGYIQLTGKENYRKFAQTVADDILNNPDLVASKYPLLSAAWFWHNKSLNATADKGASHAVVTDITRSVNGGTNGLEKRIQYFQTFHALLA